LVVEASDEADDGSGTFGAVRDAAGNWSLSKGKGWDGAALAEFDAISDKGAVRTLLNEARMALSSELQAEEAARMARDTAPSTEQELQSQLLRRQAAARLREQGPPAMHLF
jgi:hypothetical protein